MALTLHHPDGRVVKVGDTVVDFRGCTTTVESWTAPHKEGAAGYVSTPNGRHYVTVYGLFWETAGWAAAAQTIVNNNLAN